MKKDHFCINGTCRSFTKLEDGKEKFFLEILASTADIDLEEEIISGDALRGAQHDLLKNNTVLEGHDRDVIIGSVVESEFIAPKQLKLVLLISNTRPDIQQKIRENALNKASIGGRMLNWKEEQRNGKTIRIITRIRLHEVSLVSLPANQEARSLSWWVDKDENGIEFLILGFIESTTAGGGDNENMTEAELKAKAEAEAKVKAEAEGNGGTIELVGFEFDASELETIGKDVEAEVRGRAIMQKMLHITGRLKNDSPDEGVAKAAVALEGLIGQLSTGSAKAESDHRLSGIETMLQEILEGKGSTPEAKKDEKPTPGNGTRVIVRRAAPPQDGGTPETEKSEDKDAAIHKDLADCKTFSQRLAVLKKHNRFSIPA